MGKVEAALVADGDPKVEIRSFRLSNQLKAKAHPAQTYSRCLRSAVAFTDNDLPVKEASAGRCASSSREINHSSS